MAATAGPPQPLPAVKQPPGLPPSNMTIIVEDPNVTPKRPFLEPFMASMATPGSPLGGQTADGSNGKTDAEKLINKMSDVILTMNKQIEVLTLKLERMDDEKRARDDPDRLKEINHKDISKPGKYSGTGWTLWAKNFSSFLERRDKRWPKLLTSISSRSAGPPLNSDAKNMIAVDLGIYKDTLMEAFTDQLYDYLQEFTSGDVLTTVIAGGKPGSWETWRYLSEAGKSRQKVNLKEEHRKLMHPKQVDLEVLLKTIHSWESDCTDHVQSGGKRIPDDERIMCIEEMCPAPLQEFLAEKATEDEKLNTSYDDVKNAIAAYVTRKLRHAKSSKAMRNFQQAESDEDAETHGDADVDVWSELERLCSLNGDLQALVGNKFGKKGKGKGKGAGGGKASAGAGSGPAPMDVDHSGKDCYECGEVGHIAANCAVRKVRLAQEGQNLNGKGPGSKGDKGKAGGKGAGGGKGKGGKGGWPSLPQWQQMYPGPSQAQWRNWYPQSKVNLLEQPQQSPQQLAAMQQVWSFLQPPTSPGHLDPNGVAQLSSVGGSAYAFTVKGKKTNSLAKARFMPVECNCADGCNRFASLQQSAEEEVPIEPEDTKLTVKLEDAIKPMSRNRWRKQAKQQKQVDPEIERLAKLVEEYENETDDVQAEKERAQAEWALKQTTGQEETSGKPTITDESAHQDTADDAKNILDNSDILRMILHGVKVGEATVPLGQLRAFWDKRAQKLCGIADKNQTDTSQWERISAIVDSGASITAMSPKKGRGYKVQENEASRNGVEYATAGKETLPNLGEKVMAVLTKERTLRLFKSQMADVSEPLESVRQLVGNRHCVLFGLGENDDQHLIVNKLTGEINFMRDDGVNYLHDMLVVPPDEVNNVQAALQGGSPFGGQA